MTVMNEMGKMDPPMGMPFDDKRMAGGGTSYSLDWNVKRTYYTPTVFFRLEFRPQARIGLSVAALYDFVAKAATQNMTWANPPRVVQGAKLNKLSIEPTLSVYF